LAKSKYSGQTKKKSVLDKTLDFFVHSSYHAYLVGGYVRDTSLGLRPVDIDIVVEGDAVGAAKDLNRTLKGTLTSHKNFGTASILAADERIDLASARKEKYLSPAQLPRVSPSNIIEDLNRRDFTINAIAMSISKENFGEIFDPFKGLDDINRGFIRILHKNSFVDDPTRIFRALKYKNRFNFKIEKRTRAFLKDAIDKKLITRLSGQRILNEIKLIFAEQNYASIIKDLSDYKIFKLRQKDMEMLRRIEDNRLYFFLQKINLSKLPLTQKERKIVDDMKKLRTVVSRLSKTSKPSTLYNILVPLSDDALSCISAIGHDLREKITLFRKSKKIKPYISGNDLKRLGLKPGRKFSTLLKKIFDLQLDKKLKSRKEALACVKEHISPNA
jgi:tRNA nucleotidyltransferase (CCA-adding enzyme)